MISEIVIVKVYLAQGATDLRKSIDELAAIVKEEFELDTFSNASHEAIKLVL